MNCKYCGVSFKLSRHQVEPSVCLECSGVMDDFSISDEELKVEVWNLQNPSGKVKPVFDYDLESEEY